MDGIGKKFIKKRKKKLNLPNPWTTNQSNL
jgi:hypothetical protein